LKIIKVLDDFGGDASIENDDGICPVHTSMTEDFKDIKMYFISNTKYKNKDFSIFKAKKSKLFD
jgi:hypothetical protein